MKLGLEGARALVCGGSRGLGAAIAAALHSERAAVAIAARKSESLETTAQRCEAIAVPVDLSTGAGAADAVAQAVVRLGGLDLLVVNSGGPPAGAFDEIDDAAWNRAIDGTLLSAIRLIREALPHLSASDRAAILVVLSSSVRAPIERLVTSNVLRPGLTGLIKTLAVELAPTIRINGAAPGRVVTERADELDGLAAERLGCTVAAVRSANAAAIPLGRYGSPQEFGAVAAFLLSGAASYVNGHVLPVDGAMTRTYP